MAKEEWDDRVPKPDPDGVRRYGKWAGRPTGEPENRGYCVVQIYPGGRGAIHRQCGSRRGHGPGGIYCAHHDPARIARIKQDLAAVEQRKKTAQAAIEREGRRLKALLRLRSAYVDTRGLDVVERLVVPFAAARDLVDRIAGLERENALLRGRASGAAS